MKNKPLKYIYKNKWGYSIIYHKKYYGKFKKEQTAIDIRNYLMEHDWIIPFHGPTLLFLNHYYYIVNQIKDRIKVYSVATTKKQAIHQLNNIDDTSNIYPSRNQYAIHRTVNKHRYNYRTYQTLEEAQDMRNWLIAHNWNQKEFEKEYNRRYPKLPKYIYKTNDGWYFVKKEWKSGPQQYGRYITLKEAILRRDYLIAHNWNVKVQRGIMEENGIWYVRRNTRSNRKPFKKFYYKTESKEKAEQKYLEYKTKGYPKPYKITNKYRSIVHKKNMYYIIKKDITYGYTFSLKDAVILRTILENLNWKKPPEGIYIYDKTRYKIQYNTYNTPVFEK